MIVILTIAVFLLGENSFEQNVSYEQLALDHFFAHTWPQEYHEYKSIEFENRTGPTYAGHVYGCRQWDETTKNVIANAPPTASAQIQVHASGVSVRKKTKSKRLKMSVGHATLVGTVYVVQIDVYKPLEFVHHYFVKLSSDGTIVETCVSPEVI